MRRVFRRSILWLLPVVIVPLGALFAMQYRFLRTLEQKSASAERNWMRNALERVTMDLESRFRADSAAALSISEAQLPNAGPHFAAHPVLGARTYFAMRFHGSYAEVHYFDAHGREKIPAESEAEAVKMSTVAWHVAYKWQRVAQPSIATDDRDHQNRVVLRPVVDASWRVVGVTGVVLDEALARAAATSIATHALNAGAPHKDISVRIASDFPRLPNGREYITQPLGFAFSDWRVGMRDLCMSPEEIAADSFRNNAMWTGGAFIVLLGAVGLAISAVARQARLSQMKSDFVSNVSHELRTPLSSIRVFGEYMRLGRVERPEKIREYGEYIEAESRRLTQLINNILDFSKIESAEKRYRFSETDVIDLVRHTVAGFEMPLRDQGVSIAFSAPAAGTPRLCIDKDALAQVVVNLLDNAVKYSNGGKEVEVAVTSSRDEVRIAVRDHGIGIAAADQKKIFEKFYRVGSGLVHDVKGSGLGLSIVAHVVKAHGGRVEIESTPGLGSTFTIVLPVARPKNVMVTTTEYA